jgi:predicted DNA-binding protein YlxM (UPF0122 family)
MAARTDPEAALAGRERVAALADLYGALLTPRQREIVGLYYAEDLSLAEVAERTAVSRQAVHDLLRRAVASLEAYEARLGLLQRDQARRREAAALLVALEAARRGQAPLTLAEALARRLAEG